LYTLVSIPAQPSSTTKESANVADSGLAAERGTDGAVDVVVVGGGNAGFSAAHAAAQRGRRVLLLEKGTPERDGGNSYYTAGAFRIAHGGLDDVADLLDPDDRLGTTTLPPYDGDAFRADMARVTGGRNDPLLTDVLVDDSQDTLRWLHGLGLRFRLMYERQAYANATGGHTFWGGLAIGSTGGGKGLVAQHTQAALAAGVQVRCGQ
jgi:tricarballylate dehydrogenase